jgi:hypothetical protein
VQRHPEEKKNGNKNLLNLVISSTRYQHHVEEMTRLSLTTLQPICGRIETIINTW